jgi:predicted nucleic acid-binding protein
VSGWLLDTNVLSELRRPKPERKAVTFVAAQPLDELFVSSVIPAGVLNTPTNTRTHGFQC